MTPLAESIRQLSRNGEAIQALVATFTDAQLAFKPAPDTWSVAQVLEHLYNEERRDFRKHLRTALGEQEPPMQHVAVSDAHQALKGLLAERAASVAWLTALEGADWEAVIHLRFGPDDEMDISAGEMLASWLEHDVLHLRQLVELMHAVNAARMSSLAVRYAGGW
jgi:hypothetical protein